MTCTREPRCTCSCARGVPHPNPSGHAGHCPAYARWLAREGRESDRSMPPIDRGMAVYVWVHPDVPAASFAPVQGWDRHEVSAPIGWSLAPHPDFGVVLQSTSRGPWTYLDAYQVALRGFYGHHGFRSRPPGPA